jgi:hypothetical protein
VPTQARTIAFFGCESATHHNDGHDWPRAVPFSFQISAAACAGRLRRDLLPLPSPPTSKIKREKTKGPKCAKTRRDARKSMCSIFVDFYSLECLCAALDVTHARIQHICTGGDDRNDGAQSAACAEQYRKLNRSGCAPRIYSHRTSHISSPPPIAQTATRMQKCSCNDPIPT